MTMWDERISRLVRASTLWKVVSSPGESYVVTKMTALRDTTARMAQDSFLFQWLTKEPEPDIVIIDLHETRTVGPIIRILKWAVERIQPYWQGAGLNRGYERLVKIGEQASKTRVGIMIGRLLAPPDLQQDEPEEDPEQVSERE
jgi:hypothetical protein